MRRELLRRGRSGSIGRIPPFPSCRLAQRRSPLPRRTRTRPCARALFPPTGVRTPVCVPLQRRGGADGNDGAGRSALPAGHTAAARAAAIEDIQDQIDAIDARLAGPMSSMQAAALQAESAALCAQLGRILEAPTVRAYGSTYRRTAARVAALGSMRLCMARMLAPVGVLDSSGVACWGGTSSGDEWGGTRQVGTASHVNRGRSFVWLHASVRGSVCLYGCRRVSVLNPLNATFVGLHACIKRFSTGV